MGKYTLEDEPDRTLPEDALFRATLVDVKEKTIEWTDRQTKEKKTADLLEWWFEIKDQRDDGLYDGRKVKAECSARLTNHPNNRFRVIAEQLLGRSLDLGVGIDPAEDLVGLQCDLSVRHREYEKNGETRIAEEVDEIIGLNSDDVPF